MAELRPFSALRYRADIDLSAATCPPYDVLSAEERAALLQRSPYATARLILPEGEGDARYENAANQFSSWLSEGSLVPDEDPALYVVRTEFTEPGSSEATRRSRLGLVGLLRLHEYADKVVLPHEKTLDKPKADRLKLLAASQANFESIMGLVDDPGSALYEAMQAATEAEPLSDFVGDDNQRHTLFAVTDEAAIAKLQGLLTPQPVFIADGHHRYETSVAYAKSLDALGTDKPEAFLLVTLHSHADPGLVVLPTHRLVRGTEREQLNTLFRHLEPIFDIIDVDAADLEGRLRLAVQNQPIMGMVLPSGSAYQLTLRDAAQADALLPADLDPSVRQLEPVLLLHLILGPALGINANEVATTDRLSYTRSFEEAIKKVHDGEADIAFLLGRPPVTAVRDASLAGAVMPQKSTFFYPKLVSGLVMRRF
jgi:uncharacterized protein (DUF1015 family)